MYHFWANWSRIISYLAIIIAISGSVMSSTAKYNLSLVKCQAFMTLTGMLLTVKLVIGCLHGGAKMVIRNRYILMFALFSASAIKSTVVCLKFQNVLH